MHDYWHVFLVEQGHMIHFYVSFPMNFFFLFRSYHKRSSLSTRLSFDDEASKKSRNLKKKKKVPLINWTRMVSFTCNCFISFSFCFSWYQSTQWFIWFTPAPFKETGSLHNELSHYYRKMVKSALWISRSAYKLLNVRWSSVFKFII